MFIFLGLMLAIVVVFAASMYLAIFAALEPKKTEFFMDACLVGAIVFLFFLLVSPAKAAGLDCYKTAQVPAHVFFMMSPAEQKAVNYFTALSEDGDQCREVLVLDGELAESGTIFMPFGQLYQVYVAALESKDKAKIKFLFENVKPTMKSIDSFLKLPFIAPPGGWEPAQQLAKVFEVDEFIILDGLGDPTRSRIPTPARFILGALFQAWGGKVLADCDEHFIEYEDKNHSQEMNMVFDERQGHNIELTLATFLYVYSGLEPKSLHSTGVSNRPIILEDCNF